jgi:hypothetical protein
LDGLAIVVEDRLTLGGPIQAGELLGGIAVRERRDDVTPCDALVLEAGLPNGTSVVCVTLHVAGLGRSVDDVWIRF